MRNPSAIRDILSNAGDLKDIQIPLQTDKKGWSLLPGRNLIYRVRYLHKGESRYASLGTKNFEMAVRRRDELFEELKRLGVTQAERKIYKKRAGRPCKFIYRSRKPWMVRVRQTYVGSYDTEEEARAVLEAWFVEHPEERLE